MAEDLVLSSMADLDVRSEVIRVALVGGARLHRAALRHFIQQHDDVEIVGDIASVTEARPGTDSARADVVLLDVDDVASELLGTLERLRAAATGAAILLLVGSVAPDVLDSLVLAGARGVVFKDAAENQLLTAIRRVHRGELWISRAAASRLVCGLSRVRRATATMPERSRIESLSPREREVVTFVADGLCNKAIARKMGISDNTVRHHLTSVYSKLATRDRLELVIFAFRRGVVSSMV